MISQKMQDALNAHIRAEYYSAYLYLSMSAYCEAQTYKGFAKWLRIQKSEETAHANKMLDYLLERGGKASFGIIEAPPGEFNNLLSVFESVLAHEREVTRNIQALYETAVSEKDLAAQIFLQWFIAEQVEEEARAAEIVQKLQMIGDKPATLLYLDKEYGKRQPA